MSHPIDSLTPPMTKDAVSFYHVETAHEARLAVKLSDGQLYNARTPDAEGFTPLIALRVNTLPDMLFLTTAPHNGQQPQIWLEHYTARGTVLSVLSRTSGDAGQFVALEDPARPGKHFTTRPFYDDLTANPVVGDCHHVMRWEEYTLLPTEGTDHLYRIASDIAALYRHNLTASELVQFIQSYQGDNLLPALDSLVPIIRWDVLEQVSDRLLHDTALLNKLSSIVPETLWLDKAFPQLAEWEKRRWAHTGRAFSPFPTPQTLHSPASDSFLAWSGSDGSFAGLLHALTHAARRSIQPQRRVCMLTTMRNEGLYLLEWIAYHRTLGVEHFFIYSNDNTDHSETLLNELAEQGIITWVNNPTDGKSSPQFKAYGHALNVLPDILNFQWCFIMDGDEFITLDPKAYPSLLDYLDWIEHWQTDAIAINWRFIGSRTNKNGLADLDEPLTKRNSRIIGNGAIGDGWRLVKSACRPNKTLHSRAHHPIWNPVNRYTFRLTNGSTHDYQNPPPGFPRDPAFADEGYFDRIAISHYYFKSIVEWTWKHARNSGADATKGLDTSRYNNQWANAFGLQVRDPQHERNVWMLARQEALAEELRQLRHNPTICAAETAIRATLSDQVHDLWADIHARNIFKNIDAEWQFILHDLELEMKDRIPPVSHQEKH